MIEFPQIVFEKFELEKIGLEKFAFNMDGKELAKIIIMDFGKGTLIT